MLSSRRLAVALLLPPALWPPNGSRERTYVPYLPDWSELASPPHTNKQVDDAGKIKNSDIAKELSLPPVKLHCSSANIKFNYASAHQQHVVSIVFHLSPAVLAEDAIKAALKDYKLKQQDREEVVAATAP